MLFVTFKVCGNRRRVTHCFLSLSLYLGLSQPRFLHYDFYITASADMNNDMHPVLCHFRWKYPAIVGKPTVFCHFRRDILFLASAAPCFLSLSTSCIRRFIETKHIEVKIYSFLHHYFCHSALLLLSHTAPHFLSFSFYLKCDNPCKLFISRTIFK